MVKQIYDENTYSRIEREREDSAYYIQLVGNDIDEWKDNGFFAFLKWELQIYHDLYFACHKVSGRKACVYSFFFKNKEARDRFRTLVCELFNNNKKVRLVDCEPSADDDSVAMGAGSIAACPLF